MSLRSCSLLSLPWPSTGPGFASTTPPLPAAPVGAPATRVAGDPVHRPRLADRVRGRDGGFLCYVGALALAPLALVQSLSAGGIGILAFLSSRVAGVKLARRELLGVVIAVVGLVFLGISLAGATGEGDEGEWAGRPHLARGLGGARCVAVRYGSRLWASRRRTASPRASCSPPATWSRRRSCAAARGCMFIPAMIVAYSFGTIVLQLGFQKGAALTTAGVATLFTNALPIIAGTTLYDEPFPNGELGVLRGIAFALLIAGGALLSRPKPESAEGLRPRAGGLVTRCSRAWRPPRQPSPSSRAAAEARKPHPRRTRAGDEDGREARAVRRPRPLVADARQRTADAVHAALYKRSSPGPSMWRPT